MVYKTVIYKRTNFKISKAKKHKFIGIPESVMHRRIVDGLKKTHPSVYFRSDYAGVTMARHTAAQAHSLQRSKGYPDLQVFSQKLGYIGLFIELKKDESQVFYKNGDLKNNKHVREQYHVMSHLESIGYCCVFCCGILQANTMIDSYLRVDSETVEFFRKKSKML